jgi:5'-nucleotidase
MLGVHSFAISLGFRIPFGSEYADVSHYKNAADFAAVLAKDILENGIPQGTLLNVNVPEGNENGVAGVRVTRLGKRVYRDKIYSREDPAGRTYYWIGGEEPGHVDEEGTDFRALEDGYISVTPMRYDLTNHAMMDEFKERDLPASLNGQAD